MVTSCTTGNNLEVENQILRLENRELKEEIRSLRETIEMQSTPLPQEEVKDIKKLPPPKTKTNAPPKFSM